MHGVLESVFCECVCVCVYICACVCVYVYVCVYKLKVGVVVSLSLSAFSVRQSCNVCFYFFKFLLKSSFDFSA